MALAGRATAAGILGLPLTVGLVGLVILAWPGDPSAHALPFLLLVAPIWVAVMAVALWLPTGRRAWAVLGGATLACFTLIFLLKHFGWARLPT